MRHIQRAVVASSSPYERLRAEITSQGIFSLPMDQLKAACDRILSGRYTLATASGSGRPVRIVGIGTSYTHFNSKFYDRAVGLRFEDGPDVEYGRWIAHTMAQALDSMEGSFSEVDAEVRYSSNPLRIRYDRMIIPFVDQRGQRFVLSTSSMRNDIDLRSLPVDP